MMYDYHYRKISLQLTRDLTPVRVILSMRNKFNSPKVNSNFLLCLGTKQRWGGGLVGRKKSYDNTLQSDKDDKVHDKSLATGYSSAISFSLSQQAPTQGCKQQSFPLEGAKHIIF